MGHGNLDSVIFSLRDSLHTDRESGKRLYVSLYFYLGGIQNALRLQFQITQFWREFRIHSYSYSYYYVLHMQYIYIYKTWSILA